MTEGNSRENTIQVLSALLNEGSISSTQALRIACEYGYKAAPKDIVGPKGFHCSRLERDVLDASDEPSDAALRHAATNPREMVGIQNWAKAELKRRGL